MKKKRREPVLIPCSQTGPEYVNPFDPKRIKSEEIINKRANEYRKRHGSKK